MAKGGPPRPMKTMKPTNSTVAKFPKKIVEKRERAEPKTTSASIKKLRCPARLNTVAQAEWRRLVGLYSEFEDDFMGGLDLSTLMVYCEQYATYTLAMGKLAETTIVYKSSSKEDPKINPWLKVANEAADKMLRYGQILLLDPISRARMGLARVKAEELDPMEVFMKNRG